jgi:hypothetical protein
MQDTREVFIWMFKWEPFKSIKKQVVSGWIWEIPIGVEPSPEPMLVVGSAWSWMRRRRRLYTIYGPSAFEPLSLNKS